MDELLACVDETGEITGEFVSRKDFYDGKCPNKRICGVVFWIFDKRGNLLLTERGAGKEQGAGKISPPSGHVQYERAVGEKERPIQACFSEIEEEIGLSWNYENFPFTDNYYPVGVIHRPKGSAENCEMIVKHYALLLGDGVKEKIKNNEAKRIFFESWDTAVEKFGIDDSTQGEYHFFGTNKDKILYELKRFVYKVNNLSRLGPNATWDTIALNDMDAVEEYRQDKLKRPQDREGYVTWEMISTREDLWHFPEVESTIFDIITTKEDVSLEEIKDIIYLTAKVIPTRLEDTELGRTHTRQDFSEMIVSKSEIDSIARMTRIFRKIENEQGQNSKEEDYTQRG